MHGDTQSVIHHMLNQKSKFKKIFIEEDGLLISVT